MDIKSLTLFRHLATSLHFGRTSRACNVTPSALTRTVQRLEAEVGRELFLRDKRSVALTRAGELFRDYAEEVLERWAALQNELAADTALRGELSIYCSVTAASFILPGILQRFRREHPAVHINLQTGDAARALAKLENNEADCTIAARPDRLPNRFRFMDILETPLVFIAPGQEEDAALDGWVDIDWRRTPVIMAEQGLSRERLERWFANQKIVPLVYAQVAGNEAIIALVRLGCGIGVVPGLVLERSPLRQQVRVLPVSPPLAPFVIGICTSSRNMEHPRVRAFWEIAAEETRGGL